MILACPGCFPFCGSGWEEDKNIKKLYQTVSAHIFGGKSAYCGKRYSFYKLPPKKIT